MTRPAHVRSPERAAANLAAGAAVPGGRAGESLLRAARERAAAGMASGAEDVRWRDFPEDVLRRHPHLHGKRDEALKAARAAGLLRELEAAGLRGGGRPLAGLPGGRPPPPPHLRGKRDEALKAARAAGLLRELEAAGLLLRAGGTDKDPRYLPAVGDSRGPLENA